MEVAANLSGQLAGFATWQVSVNASLSLSFLLSSVDAHASLRKTVHDHCSWYGWEQLVHYADCSMCMYVCMYVRRYVCMYVCKLLLDSDSGFCSLRAVVRIQADGSFIQFAELDNHGT